MAYSTPYYPVEDSYVVSASPLANFGLDPALLVKNDPQSGFDRKTYIRFETSSFSLASPAAHVALSLNVIDSQLGVTQPGYLYEFEVFGLLQPSIHTWAEESIVWSNAPANMDGVDIDPSLTVSVGLFQLTGKGIGSITLDTPELRDYFNGQVQAGETADLIIRRNTPRYLVDGDYVHAFASRQNEAAAAPRMDVVVPEPMTFGTVGVMLLGAALYRRFRTSPKTAA